MKDIQPEYRKPADDNDLPVFTSAKDKDFRLTTGFLAVAQLISWGSIYYSFSLFIVPLEQEFHWSRPDITLALTLGLLAAGAVSVPLGLRIDQHGGRGVMTTGSVLAGSGLLIWSQLDLYGAFVVLWIFLGAAMSATLYEPAFAVLTARYPERSRKAITVVTLVGGFASTVFVPLTQFLIDRWGWRDALLTLASCNLAICAPIHFFILRSPKHTQRGFAVHPPQDASSTRSTLRHPAFWCLTGCFALYNLATSMLTFHLVPLGLERQLSAASIAGCIAIIGPMQVLGRLLLMTTNGFVSVRAAGLFVVTGLPLSLAILIWLPTEPSTLILFSILYGTVHGIMTIVRGMAVTDFFGTKNYGAINGAIALPIMLARAAAPSAGSALWIWGGYGVMLDTAFAAALLTALLFGLGLRLARKNQTHASRVI